MKGKLINISKSYGKTIMMDEYSFKFGVNLTWETEVSTEEEILEISQKLQQIAERIVNEDIIRNQDVMKKLGKK
ncbi:MAG: hypothetical protein QXL51_00095 [Candidatus Aenigmatarchaeota archaeon]